MMKASVTSDKLKIRQYVCFSSHVVESSPSDHSIRLTLKNGKNRQNEIIQCGKFFISPYNKSKDGKRFQMIHRQSEEMRKGQNEKIATNRKTSIKFQSHSTKSFRNSLVYRKSQFYLGCVTSHSSLSIKCCSEVRKTNK